MARTLTASTKQPPRVRDVDCADVVAGLWITLADLWLLGKRYGKLVSYVRYTQGKLADPQLQNHPKRHGAELQLEEWQFTMRQAEGPAEVKRKALARQWDGLPERIHQFLRDSGGWPEGKDGREMANGLWKMAVEGKPFPSGECGF